MGSGKTTAAINFICSQGGEKFIYAAPYLDEAHRITLACFGRDFYEPPGDGGSEEEHIAKWPYFDFAVKGGKNIATTHALVKNVMVWHRDVIETIAEQSYSVIFDESPDLFSEFEQHTQDIAVLTKANLVSADVSTGAFTGTAGKNTLVMLMKHFIPPLPTAACVPSSTKAEKSKACFLPFRSTFSGRRKTCSFSPICGKPA